MNEKAIGQMRVTKTERKIQNASARLVELRKTTEPKNLEDFKTVQVLCPAKDGKKELAFDKVRQLHTVLCCVIAIFIT